MGRCRLGEREYVVTPFCGCEPGMSGKMLVTEVLDDEEY